MPERIFNYRLSRARRIVENAFGILAARFRVFEKDINLSPPKASKVVLAACSLHNWLRKSNDRNYWANGIVDSENLELGTIAPGKWREITQGLTSLRADRSTNNPPKNATNLRDRYCQYFNGEGAVPWQEKMI